jgi:20S proteasome subunit alpha 3
MRSYLARNVIGGLAGLTADANSIVNYARSAAQQHLYSYNEDIPVEALAQRVCNMKQGYTQYGGMSLLYFFFFRSVTSPIPTGCIF